MTEEKPKTKFLEPKMKKNSRRAELTEREMSVLHLIKDGHSNAEIAQGLELSQKTVENHVRNIMMKLNAGNRTEAVVIAVKKELIEI